METPPIIPWLSANWAILSAIIIVAATFGAVIRTQTRMAQQLNGPFERLRRDVAHIDKAVEIANERLNTHADDLRAMRDDIRAEQKARAAAIERLHDRVDAACKPGGGA